MREKEVGSVIVYRSRRVERRSSELSDTVALWSRKSLASARFTNVVEERRPWMVFSGP
jgi:hypothetical protein